MIHSVIFDLDGVLIDSEEIYFRLYSSLLLKFGYSLEKQEYAQCYSGKTAYENMVKIIERFGLPIDVSYGLEHMKMEEKKYLEQGIPLKTGAKYLLEYLKANGYKCAMATSSTRQRAEQILKFHGIKDYFQCMITGEEVKKGKPEPDIFIASCKGLKEKRENCIVIEDSEAGIQSAYAAQIKVLCVPDLKIPEKKYQIMTEAVLSSLTEVPDYLEKNRNG